MRAVIGILVLGCAVLTIPGCSSDDTTGTVQVSIAGSWATTVPSCVVGNPASICTLSIVLTQTGTTVSGAGFLTAVGQPQGTMTITGTVSESSAVTLSLSGSAFDADPDDTVQYSGSKTDATTITGTFSSSGSITGPFTFKKQ